MPIISSTKSDLYHRQSIKIFKNLLTLMVPLLTLACQHTTQDSKLGSKVIIRAPKSYTPAEIQQITFEGTNHQASFSSDAQKVIFVSKNRIRHTHTQVYIRDLNSKVDKRVTYQDGVNAWPLFVDQSRKIIYASSTDEIKERPILKKNFKPNPAAKKALFFEIEPFELYMSTSSGAHIKRLTDRPNFDGTLSTNAREDRVAFASLLNKNLELYQINLTNNKRQRLTISSTNEVFPDFSPDNQRLLWVNYDKDFKVAELITATTEGKEQKVLIKGDFNILSPKWHPLENSILLAANKDDPHNLELYIYDIDKSCLKRLTYLTSNELEPNFSPDGQTIIFSSNMLGESQIFIMPYSPPTACL